jgi:hypothetical protein
MAQGNLSLWDGPALSRHSFAPRPSGSGSDFPDRNSPTAHGQVPNSKLSLTQIEICEQGNGIESGVVRREWDSNPRRLAPHSFSRAAHLSALPSLQATHARGDRPATGIALVLPAVLPDHHRVLTAEPRQRLVLLLVLPSVGGVLIAQAAAKASTLGLGEDHLAQAHDLRCDLDAFVVGDELQSMFQ